AAIGFGGDAVTNPSAENPEPAAIAAPAETADTTDKTTEEPKETAPRSVSEAKVEAKLLHDVYQSTLDVMHRHYFRSDGAVLPARAMEDVFEAMENQSTAKAHWISVNTEAMNIDHEPKTEFEKHAAKKIAAGSDFVEHVQDGYYERIGSIPLRAGCVGCHSRQFGSGGKSLTRKFAGLVIRIPIAEE
ncbi:MAG: hypothetical protein ACK50J_05545, partial [Planctomyces sp.]